MVTMHVRGRLVDGKLTDVVICTDDMPLDGCLVLFTFEFTDEQVDAMLRCHRSHCYLEAVFLTTYNEEQHHLDEEVERIYEALLPALRAAAGTRPLRPAA